jgi:ATP-binding cassette subfamily B protein
MPAVADPAGQNFHQAWASRLQALRNIPPVLKIIWDSSPAVVTWGLLLRCIAALSPLALLAVARLIIDAIRNDAAVNGTHLDVSRRIFLVPRTQVRKVNLTGDTVSSLDVDFNAEPRTPASGRRR